MKKIKLPLEIFGFLIAWAAVISQTILACIGNEESILFVLIRLLSFFTIIGNTSVALYFTQAIFNFKLSFFQFFSQKNASTFILSYIIIVCLGYHLLLQDVWNPQGFQYIVDRFLHLINPLYFLIYWLIFEAKKTHKWHIVPQSLILPLIYLAYVLFYGEIVKKYPYPFFDINELGYIKVIFTALILGIGICITTLFFVGISKIMLHFSEKR
ncbi:MAG: Pr6Pr family membrane protein [Chitinophagales bacterium]